MPSNDDSIHLIPLSGSQDPNTHKLVGRKALSIPLLLNVMTMTLLYCHLLSRASQSFVYFMTYNYLRQYFLFLLRSSMSFVDVEGFKHDSYPCQTLPL